MKTKETTFFRITEHLSVIFNYSANNETKIEIGFYDDIWNPRGYFVYLTTSDYIEPTKQLSISIIHEIIAKALVFEKCREYRSFLQLFDIDNTPENKKTYDTWKILYCRLNSRTLHKPSEHTKIINKIYPIDTTLALKLLYKELN